MNIKNIIEVPHLVAVIAFWTYHEWGKSIGRSFNEQFNLYYKRQNTTNIPMCFVALEKGCPIGTVSLIEEDKLIGHEKYRPWVSGLYVYPEYRGRGIAKKLLAHAEKIVKNKLASNIILLHTPNAQDYYLKLGWLEKEKTKCILGQTTVMYKNLT